MSKPTLTLVSERDVAFVRDNWPRIQRVLSAGDATEPYQEQLALHGAIAFSGSHQLWLDDKWVMSRYNMDPVQFLEMFDKFLQQIPHILRDA